MENYLNVNLIIFTIMYPKKIVQMILIIQQNALYVKEMSVIFAEVMIY